MTDRFALRLLVAIALLASGVAWGIEFAREELELAPPLRVDEPRVRFEPSSTVILGDPVSWRVEGLGAETECEIIADLTDEWGFPWRASATFVTDAEGTIDPAQHAPAGGDYAGIDPLGLFWAGARSEQPEGNTTSPAVSSTFTLSVMNGDEVVTSEKLSRWIVAPNVEEHPLEAEGIVGHLYLPKEAVSAPAVVLLGGSGGGLLWQRLMAGLLASKGYPALALAYFNAPGLPNRLSQIPIETVSDALRAFGEQVAVDPERIALIGYSKGAELALLSAVMFGNVRVVIAYAPSSVVFQAFLPPDFPSISSWSQEGEDLPFVPLRGYRRSATSVENWMTYLGNEEAVAVASIPVEFARAAVLLLSGRDDTIWPSAYMADNVIDRLREMEFDLPFAHLAFPDAGHGIARPGYLPTGPTAERNGGTPAGNARAQTESWQALLQFLAANL